MPRATIQHIIYTIIPYKGYGIRAWSPEIDVSGVREDFMDWLVPYDQGMFKGGYEARALLMSPRGVLYLSRIFLGSKLDELKRDGVVSHIAAIPSELLEQGLTMIDVEKAMIDYVGRHGIGLKEVEPIELEWSPPSVDPEISYLRNIISREQTRKILEGFNKPNPKIAIVYKRGVWDRIKLSYSIARLLWMHGLRPFMVLSDRPLDHVTLVFNNLAMIISRMLPIRGPGDWTIVNIKVEETESKVADVDETLRKIYGD